MNVTAPSPALASTTIDTPVGSVLAVASDRGLCGLPFLSAAAGAPQAHSSQDHFDRRLRRWFGTAERCEDPQHPVIASARAWLDAYFDGVLDAPLPPLDMQGAPFERRVWMALLDVPVGTTTTYGAIARRLGNPKASRAVGLANGANPVPIIVPCHRIIGASGTLTGYGGGLERKAWLLSHERRYWGAAPLLI